MEVLQEKKLHHDRMLHEKERIKDRLHKQQLLLASIQCDAQLIATL